MEQALFKERYRGELYVFADNSICVYTVKEILSCEWKKLYTSQTSFTTG